MDLEAEDWADLERFCALDCNRLNFIKEYLKIHNVETVILKNNEKNHIYIKFPKKMYDASHKIKTVIAHYDRAPNTCGANDNSFAVFCLMKWACSVSDNAPHNIRLIFTDGEEAGIENGRLQQGALLFAESFKRLGITDDVFVFDCMGRGTIPILAKNDFSAFYKKNKNFEKKIRNLEKKAFSVLRSACQDSFAYEKLPLSDNASFLACAIPAVEITMLPKNELFEYVQNQKIPDTWQFFHTMKDSVDFLTAESSSVFFKIIQELEKL